MAAGGALVALVAVDPIVNLALRLGFAALFGATLVHKLVDFLRFRLAVAAYFRGTPLAASGAAAVMAVLAIGLESLALVACLGPVSGAVPAALVGGVLVLYALAMGLNLLRGNVLLDCGCSFGAARHPVQPRLVLRNGALALLAGVMALPVAPRTVGALDYFSAVACVAVAVLAFFIVGQFSEINRQRAILEQASKHR